MKTYHYFVICYWEYFYDEDFVEPEDGGHTWAEDHYEYFKTEEEAKEALPQYLKIDEDAHIFESDELIEWVK